MAGLPGPGTSDTYGYVGTSETVARIANSGGTVTDSIVSATGDRIGVKVGSTVNWLLPDLHGNTGASLSADEAAVTNAIRYDAYGMTLATGRPGTSPDPVGEKAWKYQGRLDISPEGLATPLYDMGARFYAPGIGGFTQLDTVAGSAQNPLSMNRFLYAQGNPATLIDPDGHAACSAYADFCPVNGSNKVTVQNTAKHTGKRTAREVYADYHRHRRSQARYGEGGRYDAKRTSPLVAKATSKRMAADASAADDRESAAQSSASLTYGSTPPGELSVRAQFIAKIDNYQQTGCFGECMTWADVPVIGQYIQDRQDEYDAGHPPGSTAIAMIPIGPSAVKGVTASRTAELQAGLPAASAGRVTMGVGLGRSASGAVRTVVASSERGGYLRAGVRALLRPGDIVARGAGHAEIKILDTMAAEGITPITLGAGRPICPTCARAIEDAGATYATPLR